MKGITWKGFVLAAIVAIIFMSSCASLPLKAQMPHKELETKAIESVSTFREFLAIRNDAQYVEEINKNVVWCKDALLTRGFETQEWETETRPLMYGNLNAAAAGLPTVLFYFHIDGQSVDPQFWFQKNPYEAVLKKSVEGEGWVDMDWSALSPTTYDPNWYMFARSASDSKNNFMMLLTALDFMKEHNQSIPYNLKVILDFEEEKSSPSLAKTVEQYKDILAADMLVIYDGPRHISNEPTLAFGARGIASLTLTVYGPVFPQHSGHYGNYAPNPALRLAQILASMKDADGRVLIEGFYDGITFDQKTLDVLNAVPDNEQVIQAKLGFKGADKVADTYQKALQYPSLNIRGMLSGWVGSERRTIIPSQATAEMDIRLVIESDPDRLLELVRNHIESQGYHIIDHKPTQRERLTHERICRMSSKVSYQAFRTDFDTRIGRWLTQAMNNAYGKDPVRTRTMGGSIPIAPFIETLGVPAVVVPTANRDNNQHSPNENIRLGNYVEGVKTLYSILSTPID